MTVVNFKTNVITSDGAKLLRNAAENNDSVYIYKTAYINYTFPRDVASNLHYSDIKRRFYKELQHDPNVTAAYSSASDQDSSGNICIVTSQSANNEPFPVHGVLVLACLYSEREDPNPVVFSVMCDDNIVFECGEEPIKMSIILPVSSENFYTFGESDELNGLKVFNVGRGAYSVYLVKSGGISYTLNMTEEGELYKKPYVTSKDSTIVSFRIIDKHMVFVMGNGRVYMIPISSFESTNVFDERTNVTLYMKAGTKTYANNVTQSSALPNGANVYQLYTDEACVYNFEPDPDNIYEKGNAGGRTRFNQLPDTTGDDSCYGGFILNNGYLFYYSNGATAKTTTETSIPLAIYAKRNMRCIETTETAAQIIIDVPSGFGPPVCVELEGLTQYTADTKANFGFYYKDLRKYTNSQSSVDSDTPLYYLSINDGNLLYTDYVTRGDGFSIVSSVTTTRSAEFKQGDLIKFYNSNRKHVPIEHDNWSYDSSTRKLTINFPTAYVQGGKKTIWFEY